MRQRYTPRSSRLTAYLCSLILTVALLIQAAPSVYAATLLGQRFDKLSSSNVSATTTHLIGLTVNEVTVPLGSIEIEFCSNDPIPNSPCVPSSGLDLTNVVLANQQGETGFSIHPNSTQNKLILSRFPVLPTVAASEYQLDDVVNPDTTGSHYVRLRTYSSDDATGTVVEEGGIAFVIGSGLNIATEVPRYLKLCAGVTIVGFDCATATSFLIDLGEFSSSSPSTATSELVVATNAGFGFTVSITGTTLTSGNNTIPAATGANSLPGTSQFGINLRANTSPAFGSEPVGPGGAMPGAGYNTVNQFRFVPSDAIITEPGVTDNRKFTVSYLTNIAANQAPGIYANTITYIALANF